VEIDDDDEELPSLYHIKNTFIDTPLQRSPSLEKLVGIRRVNSSPPAMMEDLIKAVDPFALDGVAPASPTGSSIDESEDVDGGVEVTRRRLLEEELVICTETGSASDLGGSTRAATTAEPAHPFSAGSGQISDASRQEDTLARTALPDDEPVIGSAELPSRGSALHRFGACKPCAFVGHGVCRNDVNCQFCHLCEPGEKKRRRKEWLESKREARRQAEAAQHRVVYTPGVGAFVEAAGPRPLYQQPIVLLPHHAVFVQPGLSASVQPQPGHPPQQAR